MQRWGKIEYPFDLPKGDTENTLRMMNFQHFINYFGFDLMSYERTVGSFERLLHGEKSYNNTTNRFHPPYREEELPDRDHSVIFKVKGTKRIVFVNQPYQFDKKKLEDWCNEGNLIYVDCEEKYSFYAPGVTNMVMVMSNDTYINFLEDHRYVEFPRHWNGRKL